MALRFRKIHAEVLSALEEIGNPKLGERMGPDRVSQLEYSGVRVPNRRKRVKEGFSFYDRSPEEILAIWDDLWTNSPNADVKFCAIDYYRDGIRNNPDLSLWDTIKHWVHQVENWAHSDDLCAMFSWLIEAHFKATIGDVKAWNKSEELWIKRISIVCLVRPGINSTYLPPRVVFPLVRNCLDDRRDYMQKATGWVLREMLTAYPKETEEFLQKYMHRVSAPVLTRTLERHSAADKSRWRRLRESRASS